MKKEIELTDEVLEKAHKHYFNNKEEIDKSDTWAVFIAERFLHQAK